MASQDLTSNMQPSSLSCIAAEHPLEPRPLTSLTSGWQAAIGPGTTALLLCAVIYQFRGTDVTTLLRLVPTDPRFWLCFLAYHFAAPASEWLIFHGLWSLPRRGIVALLGKQVCNEILLGYLGEVYFYGWARRNVALSAAPFGAIKDVAVLSAIIGNIFCLAMVAAAWSAFSAIDLGPDRKAIYLSVATVLLSSSLALLFRRRLFALPPRSLRWIALAHAARVLTTTVLAALMWHLLLPSVSVGNWLILAAARQIVSRLPLMPNKDLAFAGFAGFFMGHGSPIVAAMTVMASLLMLAHLAVGAGVVAAAITVERDR